MALAYFIFHAALAAPRFAGTPYAKVKFVKRFQVALAYNRKKTAGENKKQKAL